MREQVGKITPPDLGKIKPPLTRAVAEAVPFKIHEQAHQPPPGKPPFAVSLFHLALHVTDAYRGLLVAILLIFAEF